MPTNIRRTKSYSLDLRHIDEEMPNLIPLMCAWRINSWEEFSSAINLKKVDTKENTCDWYLEGCIDVAA